MSYRPSHYKTVTAGNAGQVLGAVGKAGDFLDTLVCVVATAATAQVQIKDGGGSAITVLPNSPGGGVGTYTIAIRAPSQAGGWTVITGAGVTVVASGDFT